MSSFSSEEQAASWLHFLFIDPNLSVKLSISFHWTTCQLLMDGASIMRSCCHALWLDAIQTMRIIPVMAATKEAPYQFWLVSYVPPKSFFSFLCFGWCCGENLRTTTHVGWVINVRVPLGTPVIRTAGSLKWRDESGPQITVFVLGEMDVSLSLFFFQLCHLEAIYMIDVFPCHRVKFSAVHHLL